MTKVRIQSAIAGDTGQRRLRVLPLTLRHFLPYSVWEHV